MKKGIEGIEDGSVDKVKLRQLRNLAWIDKRTLAFTDSGNHTVRTVSIGMNEKEN